jgi:hypothetical protein
VGDRALCWIAQEDLRDCRSSLLVGFAALAFGCAALRLIRAFKLMIPRRLAEQVVDLRRRVVRRRGVNAHDALLTI